MHKRILILLSVIFFLTTFTGCTQQRKSKESFEPIVSVSKMNILYKGIENPLDIYVPNYSCSEIILSISNGQISQSNCEFKAIPERIGTAFIEIKSLNIADTTVIEKAEFRVHQIPLPNPSYCGHGPSSSSIKKTELNKCKGLALYLDGFDYLIQDKIVQFDLLVFHDKCISQTFRSYSAELTDEMKNYFEKISVGDIVSFENIKATNQEIRVVEIDPVTNEKSTTNTLSERSLPNIKLEVI